VTGPTAPRRTLRELNKQRAREAIVQAATDLFSERGYATTTLAEIADTAGVSPSTLFNYYPSKSDIVFSLFNEVIESAEHRIVGRPEAESATAAVLSWVKTDLPAVEASYGSSIRRMPRIIDTDVTLQTERRLRIARLEDVIAEAYAREFSEPAEHLRPHVMATIAVRGIFDVWKAWDIRHNGDTEVDLEEVADLKATYLERVLESGMVAVSTLATVD
jgi:AcrR family transcriptional regulator